VDFYKKAGKRQDLLAEKVISARSGSNRELYYDAIRRYLREHTIDSAKDVNYRTAYRRDSTALQGWKKRYPDDVKRVDDLIGECNKIVLHPVVANLELGRCLIRADVMPRGGPLLVTRLMNGGASNNELSICRKWLRGSDSIGWKFTDDKLNVDLRGSLLTVRRKDEPSLLSQSSGYLNFNSISTRGRKDISTDFTEFSQVLPALTRSLYDYKRVDQFAKVMAVVRLAHDNGAPLLNKPGKPNFVKRPIYCKLTEKGTVDLVDEN
jgi:hypothetical protein